MGWERDEAYKGRERDRRFSQKEGGSSKLANFDFS